MQQEPDLYLLQEQRDTLHDHPIDFAMLHPDLMRLMACPNSLSDRGAAMDVKVAALKKAQSSGQIERLSTRASS